MVNFNSVQILASFMTAFHFLTHPVLAKYTRTSERPKNRKAYNAKYIQEVNPPPLIPLLRLGHLKQAFHYLMGYYAADAFGTRMNPVGRATPYWKVTALWNATSLGCASLLVSFARRRLVRFAFVEWGALRSAALVCAASAADSDSFASLVSTVSAAGVLVTVVVTVTSSVAVTVKVAGPHLLLAGECSRMSGGVWVDSADIASEGSSGDSHAGR